MTTITNFDIATDLKVEFYLAGGGTNDFVIGVSKLGGQNVLAGAGWFYIGTSLLGGEDLLTEGSSFEWTDLACVATQANIQVGGSVQDQLYFQPEPASAKVVLQSFDFDPNYSPAFRPGVEMRIRLVKDGIDETIFRGYMDSVGASYDANGNNTLSVTAFDSFKRVVNTRLDLFDTDTDFPEGYVTPYEQLEVIAEALGTSMHASSEPTSGKIPSTIEENLIPNNKIYEAIQVGLGVFWLDPATQEFVFVPRPSVGVVPEGTMVAGNFHDEPNHLCMTDLTADLSQDRMFNSLLVSLESDNLITTLRENEIAIELYGKVAKDITINTTDQTELDLWADQVYTQSPTNAIRSVEVLTKDRQGTLNEAAFMLPGEKLGVHYATDVLEIDDYFTVTKVSHDIAPTHWFTTLEVWKEA